MKDPWYDLANYESSDFVIKYHRLKHNYILKRLRAGDICAHFAQAREYFRAADLASPSVAPLLQYYGVMSLCRGLNYLLRGDDWKDVQGSHGISGRNFWNLGQGEELAGLGKLEISLASAGTLPDLLKFTSNRNYLRSWSNNPNHPYSSDNYPIPPEGTKFSFLEIVERIPDLVGEFYIWQNRSPCTAIIDRIGISGNPKLEYVYISADSEPSMIERLIEPFHGKYTRASAGGFAFIPASNLYLTQHGEDNSENGQIIFQESINGNYLNTLGMFYCASYILGMLVRYYPRIWVNLQWPQSGDTVVPLIRRLSHLIQTRFPMTVRDFLAEEATYGESEALPSQSRKNLLLSS